MHAYKYIYIYAHICIFVCLAKKEIMAKFQQMNEKLFDSLPSMINDEMMEDELGDKFDFADHLPQPFNPGSLTVGSQTFVDGMRVRSVKESCLTRDSNDKCILQITAAWDKPTYGLRPPSG